MLASLSSLARTAAQTQVGLGAFNVIQLEHATAITRAAVHAGVPVVLQISQNAVKYHGGDLTPIGRATLAVAERAETEVAVHLDHAEDVDLIQRAVDLGFNSVMYDGSRLPDEENRETTRRVVELCHAAGVDVEAELGEVGGKNGVHDPSARTSPADAAQFVADTGVDLLAVAVGSSHAMTTRDARLDVELIRAIGEAVQVPLVLHGSSGVSDEGMLQAIAAGMTKINVSTHLNQVMTAAVREALAADPALVDPRKWMAPARAAVEAEVQRLLELHAGRAGV
ncbi:MAG: class II fructose-bisphosphate aldolase [Micropruina sp.]|nr:class II fructose-bisphosphate aldolase [Micropruina sp.]